MGCTVLYKRHYTTNSSFRSCLKGFHTDRPSLMLACYSQSPSSFPTILTLDTRFASLKLENCPRSTIEVRPTALLTFALDLWPWLLITGELWSWSTHEKLEFNDQSLRKIESGNKRTDRRTDRQTIPVALCSRLMRSVTFAHKRRSTLWHGVSWTGVGRRRIYFFLGGVLVRSVQARECLWIYSNGKKWKLDLP